MIIGICSYGNTGSGAVFDLLKEYDDLEVIGKDGADFEFKFTYMPDGIEDLEYHIMQSPTRWMSSDMAINRFKNIINFYGQPYTLISEMTRQKYKIISEKFLSDIVQVSWTGRRLFDYPQQGKFAILDYRIRMKIASIINSKLKLSISTFPSVKMYYSYNLENFSLLARNYIMSLVNSMKKTTCNKTVLDQPFSGDNPLKSFKYFDDPYAIIVDRDPRDLYITAKYLYPIEDCWIPTNNVCDFIKYYKSMRSFGKLNSDRLLYINFEDLLYRFTETEMLIKNFLNISTSRTCLHFNPKISINNTQLYKSYPNEKDNISMIEKELSKWIYPFHLFNVSLDHSNAF